jgi:hypothetical protein
MSKDKIVYIPTPVSEKPKGEGYYMVGIKEFEKAWFDGKKFIGCVSSTHWLKPYSLEELLKEFIDHTFKSGPDSDMDELIKSFINEKGIIK